MPESRRVEGPGGSGGGDGKDGQGEAKFTGSVCREVAAGGRGREQFSPPERTLVPEAREDSGK